MKLLHNIFATLVIYYTVTVTLNDITIILIIVIIILTIYHDMKFLILPVPNSHTHYINLSTVALKN